MNKYPYMDKALITTLLWTGYLHNPPVDPPVDPQEQEGPLVARKRLSRLLRDDPRYVSNLPTMN